MLGSLNKIAAIESLLAKISSTQINASLPIDIKVAKQLEPMRYLLKMGSREVETKSANPLDVGKHYWAEVSTGKGGVIQLNNLKQKPSFLQQKFPFKMDVIETLQTLSSKEGKATLKETFLNLASRSESAAEFSLYTNLALQLEEGKITLPFVYKDENQILQLKEESVKSENEDLKQNSVKFYAVFKNLGPLSGQVDMRGDERFLELYTTYDSTNYLLQEHIEELNFAARVSVRKEIEPLFSINEKQLVDISV